MIRENNKMRLNHAFVRLTSTKPENAAKGLGRVEKHPQGHDPYSPDLRLGRLELKLTYLSPKSDLIQLQRKENQLRSPSASDFRLHSGLRADWATPVT